MLVQPLALAPGSGDGFIGGLLHDFLALFASGRAAADPPTYPTVVLADSPLAYYRLDESSGSTAHDSSGNNQNLTYGAHATLGVTGLIAGDSDTAASDSTEALASGSPTNMPAGNSARSLEVWLATTSAPSYTPVIAEGDFLFELDNGTPRVFYSGGKRL